MLRFLASLFFASLALSGANYSRSALASPVSAELEQQREQFLAARQALEEGRLEEFERLSGQLGRYPLYPYLRYEFLHSRLEQVEPVEIRLFIARYADTPLARRLRHAWLHSLARRNEWWQYLAAYDGSSGAELRCHFANAKLETERTEGLWKMTRELWLVGKPQPDACDLVFEAWRDAGGMTQQDVLERITLAMENRQLGLVSYLARSLPEEEQKWISTWRRMHTQPEAEIARLQPADHPEWAARLFAYGIQRIARQDAVQADRLWAAHHTRFDPTQEQTARTQRAIALNLAFERHPAAAKRLAQLSGDALDATTRQWRVRAALWHQQWKEVLAALDGLSEEEKSEEEWVYWRARALEALGREEESAALLAAVARCRCYYGFLAAERVGLPPAIDTAPLVVEAKRLSELAANPAMVRTKELLAVDLDTEARREWWYAARKLDQQQLRAAAKLADLWGWHDQAILTLAKTGSLDDLELRFPTPYEEQVMQAAAERELDTAFVYSVMRQESAFNPRARSHAGALGLMQLMPATARRTAQYIQQPAPRTDELLTAEQNIRLGTAHLRQLLDEYDGNILYAMAAYNAGPHRVSRWRPTENEMPADIWLETMPFQETRNYIKRILAYIRIYQWRLGRDLTPMSHHLQTIGPLAPEPVADSEEKGEQQAG